MSLAKMFSASAAAIELEALIAESEDNNGDITAIEGQIDWLSAKAGDLSQSIDDVMSIVKVIDIRSKARKEESDRLKALAKRDADIAIWLKNQIYRVMTENGKDKIETKMHRFTITNAGGIQALELVGEIPDEYMVTITTKEPDKNMIREVLESGKVLQFAHLVPKQKVLRIK